MTDDATPTWEGWFFPEWFQWRNGHPDDPGAIPTVAFAEWRNEISIRLGNVIDRAGITSWDSLFAWEDPLGERDVGREMMAELIARVRLAGGREPRAWYCRAERVYRRGPWRANLQRTIERLHGVARSHPPAP